MMDKAILQHFHKDEHAFVEKMADLVQRCEVTYAPLLTEFLNPRQLLILQNLAHSAGLLFYSSNDLYGTEYGRALVAPDYYVFDSEDFDLVLLELSFNSKFNQLTHSQILGAFLHQLGIERSLIGDIRLGQGRAQLFLAKPMAERALMTIKKIGRAGVSLQLVPFSDLIEQHVDSKQQFLQLSSMRLDKLLAASFKLSRPQAVKLIETEKVKVDYRIQDKPASQVTVGELVSVRGFGRIRILEDTGLTKSGKHKVTIEALKHR